MSDELHKYPGNLKRHKVEPMLSDDEIRDTFMYGSLIKDAEHGFISGANYVRHEYEAARAKDSELIQRLVDDIAVLQSVFALEAGYETRWGDEGLEAAAAAGYKPTQAE